MTFLCSECPYQTENSYDLTKHRLYHSKTKNYACPTCAKLFTTASDLKRHERIHQTDKKLQCSFQNCSFVTHRSDSLVLHEKTHTGIESRLNHPCPNCSKMFSSHQIASRHLKTCVASNTKADKGASVKDTVCHICQKKFSSIYKLKIHLNIHEGKLNFQCLSCLKKFPSKYALNKHSLTHEKKFQCELCEKIFSRKDHLQTHIKNHMLKNNDVESRNPRVEYICSFCNSHFLSKVDLMKHFETDVACNKHCHQQLYQTVEEYPVYSPKEEQSNIVFTGDSAVYAEIVENNAEIILVDNHNNQEVLIIEEPVVVCII